MKNTPRRLFLAAVGFLWAANLANAHPGHDGHDLTWDFAHLAQHPIATMGCAAVAGAVIAVALQAMRRRSDERVQSLRASQRSRGK